MKRAAALFVVLALVACTTSAPPPAVRLTPIGSSPTGEVRGVVDIENGVVPGVTVTLSSSHSPTHTTVTDANGSFRIAGLIPGAYRLKAELAGLTPLARELTVQAGFAVEMNLRLRTSVAESITVTATTPSPLMNPGTFVVDATQETSVLAGAVSAEYGRHTGGNNAPEPMVMVAELKGGNTSVPAPPEPPAQSKYAHVEEHVFADAAKSPVTTFSIDVDRASYANVRRYLTASLMPPPDAVRIEEMVNYFTYSYPQPPAGQPFSITSEVASCPWDASHRLVRIGIQGSNLDEWKMAPNNLVFLLDVSGSMEPPQSLPLVKSGLRMMIEKLRAEDSVAIVVYAGAAGLVLPRTSGADKQAIYDAIERLRAGGWTDGGAGIELAYKIAQDNFLPNGNNRVILATDGDFNVGPASIPELEKLIEEKRKSGVFLSVIGVGQGTINDAIMETLADKGNGNYAYLDGLDEARKVFTREITGTLVAIAKDVKVQVEFDPSRVASYRQIGYENRALENKDFKDDTKDAGELGAGHSVTALYEVMPVPGASTAGRIANVRLRYKEPKGETSTELTAPIDDDGRTIFNASADLQFAAAVAELGMILRHSPHRGSASMDDVVALARASRGVDLDGTREEFIRLADATRSLTDPKVVRK